MKIVILQGAFLPVPPMLGGAVEKLWYSKGRHFAARGCSVLHISRRFGGLPYEEEEGGVKYIRIRGFDSPKYMFVRLLLDFLYSLNALRYVWRDADIVITNSFFSPILLPFISKALIYVDVARIPKGQMALYARSARLRANSSMVADSIKAELPEEHHSKVKIIPNPLPFSGPFDQNIEKHKLVMYCGRVHREKGLHLLGPMTEELAKLGWRMVIVGPWSIREGGSGDEYREVLEDLLNKSVTEFVGSVHDVRKLARYYAAASIFVYPSLAEQGETFGLAPLEAMAFGAAPVVSNLKCFHDFILDKRNGRIFEHRVANPSDVIAQIVVELIRDPVVLSSLQESAKNVRSTHSLEVVADNFLSDFKAMVDDKHSRLS